MMEDVLKIVLLLIGFCSLLFLTYVTTRYVGGKHNKSMKGKNIIVLETVPLGMDKRLHLVKAGNTHVLIASTSKTIEFLSVVSLDDLTSEQEMDLQQDGSLFDFKALFEKYVGVYKTKKDNAGKIYNEKIPEAMTEKRDFKTNLSRLKEIIQKSEKKVEENGDDNTNEK